ncbi:hypothetical protein BO226_17385 [Rhodococcus sp. 2G]|uniref:hypothetical protein n=1 Tax=Rhodococcus sp. 2G TaxID=1570939 RepID=UPI000903D76E|nr:hypothetical protein [Rhodococcus sp. 2G]APE10749.1 hypothetical protein BO226_17385 [Rhodococcus sp. 2G]
MQYGSVPISEVQYGSTPIGEGWMWSGGGWVQVFQAGAHYVDEFNRPNGALGADWLGSPQPTINSNAAQNSTSSGNVPQLTEYAKKLNTDRYGVLATVKTPVGTNRSAETYFYLSGRCTGTGVQNDDIVLLVAAGAALASGIYTRSASGTFTSRVPISGGWT